MSGEIHIHHHHHFDGPLTNDATSRILACLNSLTMKVNKLMATIADVQAAVAEETTVEDSVIALLNGISQQLKDAIAANDPTALQAVVDSINANKQRLADAVTANTPTPPAAA